MTRLMAEKDFRAEQVEQLYAPHIAPINRYVDVLRERGWLPYVAPVHGGVNARVLTILRDPGPATQEQLGSGFLCLENDDPSAEHQEELLASVGLGASDILPWNAYPWYINRSPRASELNAGVEPILHLIEMLPRLRVVLLQGGSAKDSWRRVQKTAPNLVPGRGLTVVSTYHPGRQALWVKDPDVRAMRVAHQLDAFGQVANALGDVMVPAK